MLINQGCCSHIGRRKNQQDAYGFSDFADTVFIAHGGILAVVCDGMGGLEKGEEASSLAVKTLLDSYMAKPAEQSVSVALDNAIASANSEVVQLGLQTGHDGNVGSTLVAAVVHNDELYWRSAGDSRIYLLREGKLTQLSTDQTYAQELLQNEMSPEDAASHPDSNALVNFLGADETISFGQNKAAFKLQASDVLLLCSDGIYNVLNEDEIIDALSCVEAMQAATELQHQVLDKQRINQDNLTAVVLRFQADDSKKRHSFFSWHTRAPYIFSLLLALTGGFGFSIYVSIIDILTISLTSRQAKKRGGTHEGKSNSTKFCNVFTIIFVCNTCLLNILSVGW